MYQKDNFFFNFLQYLNNLCDLRLENDLNENLLSIEKNCYLC